MSLRRREPALVLLALTGCGPSSDVPGDFAALPAWLYAHAADEEPDELVAGIDQLALWLDQTWDGSDEGYEVAAPTEAQVDGLDGTDRTTAGMVGLALPAPSEHEIAQAAWALVAVDQDEIFDTFADYQRSYVTGPDCFLDGGCDQMEALEDYTSQLPLGLEVHSQVDNQYRWVDAAAGQALVHRNWLVVPPEVNYDWLAVEEQLYLNVYVPRSGGAWRVQAQWTVYDEDSSVPESTAMTLVIDALGDMHADLEAWLDEHPAP